MRRNTGVHAVTHNIYMEQRLSDDIYRLAALEQRKFSAMTCILLEEGKRAYLAKMDKKGT